MQAINLLSSSFQDEERSSASHAVSSSLEPSTRVAKLVTAWRSMPEMTPINALPPQRGPGGRQQQPAQQHCGLVVRWEQRNRLVACAGDERIVRLWDAHQV